MTSNHRPRSPERPSELGVHNRHRIVDLVSRHEAISRSDVARHSGLSKAATSTIVQQLIREGLLIEPDESVPSVRPRQTTVRRGLPLQLNGQHATAIGVELTDARIAAIAMTMRGLVITSIDRQFPSDESAEDILASVCDVVREIRLGLSAAGPVRGVGVAVPGLVDAERGVSQWIPGLLRWKDVPVVDALQRSLDLPVFLDWRAYTATLAEQRFGVGRGEEDFLVVNVEDGVGMGIVLGGHLLRGTTSMAGMLAHFRVDDSRDGPTCVCGNPGCLQARVAIPALIHRAQRAVADGVMSILTSPAQTEPLGLCFEDLVAAALTGDKLASNLFDFAGETLGLVVADLIHLFNPRLIIIGGQMGAARDLLLDPIQRTARRLTLPQMFGAVRIVFSTLRPTAAILGAGAMVIRHVLEADVQVTT